ncbi:MAG: histidine phosphatase family protein [Chloroflexota bacterium]
MTEFWFVRHGQTDWNIEARYQGQQNIPLNEWGIQNANRLALELAGFPFNALYSSDLSRAVQTAQILSSPHGLQIIEDERLREIHLGIWEGLLFSDIEQKYPEYLIQRRQDANIPCAPEGENITFVAIRITSFMDEVALNYPKGKILVVTHGMMIATALCLASKSPLIEAYLKIPKNLTTQIIFWNVISSID